MAAVDGGEGFNPAQRHQLDRAVARARSLSGLDVSLYVGPLPEGRASARALHGARPDPDSAVLVAVDPGGRSLEIVTGPLAAERCDGRTCGLAAASMTASFGAGDLLGGIRNGLELIGTHAHRPPPHHLSTNGVTHPG